MFVKCRKTNGVAPVICRGRHGTLETANARLKRISPNSVLEASVTTGMLNRTL